jgi:hypothetical protein
MSATTILAAYLNNPEFSFETPHGVVPQWFSDLYLEKEENSYGRFKNFSEPAPARNISLKYTEDGDPEITNEWKEWDERRQNFYIHQRLKLFRQWLFFLGEFCDRGEDQVGPFYFEDSDPIFFKGKSIDGK